MSAKQYHSRRGFTLIELLVVIAIIGVLSSTVLFAVNDSRAKGRDAARKVQTQEVLKALELHYSDDATYPDDGTPADDATGDVLASIGSGFLGGQYFPRLPDEPERYFYCSSGDRASLVIAVNTEIDRGGSNYCRITRGNGGGTDGFGCTAWIAANASDNCSERF